MNTLVIESMEAHLRYLKKSNMRINEAYEKLEKVVDEMDRHGKTYEDLKGILRLLEDF